MTSSRDSISLRRFYGSEPHFSFLKGQLASVSLPTNVLGTWYMVNVVEMPRHAQVPLVTGLRGAFHIYQLLSKHIENELDHTCSKITQ